ncbi:hypothetical protein ACEPAI_1654 [Sanghuangporus weigelae]
MLLGLNLHLQTSRTLRNRFPNISSSENASSINSGSSAPLAEENMPASARSESASETDESTIRLSEGFSYLNLSTNSSTSNTDSTRTNASSRRESVTMASNAALNGSDSNNAERTQNPWLRTPEGPPGSGEQSTSGYVPIELDNELNSYIARKGLGSRFTENHFSTGPDHMKTWHHVMMLDGEVIATGSARNAKQAKKEAAKTALTRLHSDTKPSPVSTASQSNNPSEPDTYRKEGPPHNLTWIYTFYS